jgi:hypothetical protein
MGTGQMSRLSLSQSGKRPETFDLSLVFHCETFDLSLVFTVSLVFTAEIFDLSLSFALSLTCPCRLLWIRHRALSSQRGFRVPPESPPMGTESPRMGTGQMSRLSLSQSGKRPETFDLSLVFTAEIFDLSLSFASASRNFRPVPCFPGDLIWVVLGTGQISARPWTDRLRDSACLICAASGNI